MTTTTCGTMKTTDVGYAKQMQYGDQRARLHSVHKDDRGCWVTLCTGKPATREYKGWLDTVTCHKCQKELEGEG